MNLVIALFAGTVHSHPQQPQESGPWGYINRCTDAWHRCTNSVPSQLGSGKMVNIFNRRTLENIHEQNALSRLKM